MANELQKEALDQLLESGDTEKCLQFFQGMPEKTRRDYFTVVKPFWSRVKKVRFIEDPPGTFSWNPLEEISSLAYFATATGSEIIKAKRTGYPKDDLAFQVLADRRPDWIEAWVETLLGESYYWGHWRLIRRLILAGLLKKPTNPRYFLGMIGGINNRGNQTSLVDELSQDSDLLQEDVWKLFEYDGEGENSLANTERFDRSWIEAFLELTRQGKLPRARLLESCVEALERDFNHYRAKWFFEFFDRLEPTDNELQQLGERLLGLLGVSAPNVASWALNRVNILAASGLFETTLMCHAVEPILRARAKGTVLTTLKLLERQAAARPNEASQIAATAAQGLAHEAPDVQRATLKLLETISSTQDQTVRAIVQSHQSTLAASVRSLVTKWLEAGSEALGTTSESDTSNPLPKISKQLESLYAIDVLQDHLKKGVFAIPAAIFDGTDIPRLVRTPRLTSITNIEELIDVCAKVIEDGTQVDDAERCIDGLARLVQSKPPHFDQLTAPLMKRVRKLVLKGCSPFCGLDPGNDILGLFYTFCTGTVIKPVAKGNELSIEFEGHQHREYKVNTKKPIGFLSARCLEVAQRLEVGEACQLLSAPTHAGGWIAPSELAKRVNGWRGADPGVHDLILAMLRLAAEGRAAALKTLKDREGEWFQAVRHALGAEKVKIGGQAAIWVAAARARAPWLDDPQVMKKHPGLGPDAAEAAKVEVMSKIRKSGGYKFVDVRFTTNPPTPKTHDPMLVSVAMFSSQNIGNDLSFEMGGFAGRTHGAVRWTATVWPLARDSFFASSAFQCFANLDWSEAEWQNRTMLEPLIDSGTPLRDAGLWFLAGMLAAKEPGESGMATDVALRAIEEGRLGSDNLGRGLAKLLGLGLIKPGRWQKTLSEVARASKVHAAVIQVALQRCFEDPKQELPKESGKLLELLYELSLELGVPVTHEPCRVWLESGVATGKSQKVAKSLLAIEATPESHATIAALLEEAIKQRTLAASRQSAG